MTTALHGNPFYLLQVTVRDNSNTIVEAAEERALVIDPDSCQRARSHLTNPRTRLSAEISWMPGVAPSLAHKLIESLTENPSSALAKLALGNEWVVAELARANLMAAALELVGTDEAIDLIVEFVLTFCWVVESIDPEQVMRDINEDRAISGFTEIRSIEAVEQQLADRRKEFRQALRRLLDGMETTKLIETMTDVVVTATTGGDTHGPSLLDELVDSYEVEAQSFLQKEHDTIKMLVESAKRTAPLGEGAVSPILETLERVVRNWDRVAQPIQVSAKSRGTIHRQSREVALELRSLGIDLNNEYNLINLAHRMTELLREVFAELPDLSDRLERDADAIGELLTAAEEDMKTETEWRRSITFSAKIGTLLKHELAISPEGIRWKDKSFPLESITRVRWGGIRKSLNGIPTGTDYTIAFGDNRSEQVIQLSTESTYNSFVNALWKAVCARLVIELLNTLAKGTSMSFGDMTIQDETVTLIRHRTFQSNERVTLTWGKVHIWSAEGKFLIGHQEDDSVYGSASYMLDPNVHVLEHAISGAFRKGVSRLSDYLKE